MGCGNWRHHQGESLKGLDGSEHTRLGNSLTDLEEGHRIVVHVGWEPSCLNRGQDRE